MTSGGRKSSDPAGVAIKHSTVETNGGNIVGHDMVIGEKLVIENVILGSTGSKSDDSAALGGPARLLPYLTNRTEQLRLLATELQTQLDKGTNKPTIFFAVANEDECVDSFVEQVRFLRLPSFLKANGLPAEILYRSLRWPSIDRQGETLETDIAYHLEEVTDQVHDALAIKTSAHKSMIEQKIASSPGSCLFHIAMSLADWRGPQVQLMRAWLQWVATLDMSKSRNWIVLVVCVIYPAGFFHRLLSQTALMALQRDIRTLAAHGDLRTTVHMLPQLRSVRFHDVEQWIRDHVENVDREALRRLIRKRFSNMFGFREKKLPMYRTAEVVKAALNDPSVRMSAS